MEIGKKNSTGILASEKVFQHGGWRFNNIISDICPFWKAELQEKLGLSLSFLGNLFKSLVFSMKGNYLLIYFYTQYVI